jgi:3-oxoacyl-(acyl-carrier-protein) synthase
MATVTVRLAAFEDETCVVEMDYSNTNMLATALRVVNNSPAPCYAEIVRTSDGRKHGARFAPGTTSIAIPTTVAQRVPIELDARGRVISISATCCYPYP